MRSTALSFLLRSLIVAQNIRCIHLLNTRRLLKLTAYCDLIGLTYSVCLFVTEMCWKPTLVPVMRDVYVSVWDIANNNRCDIYSTNF